VPFAAWLGLSPMLGLVDSAVCRVCGLSDEEEEEEDWVFCATSPRDENRSARSGGCVRMAGQYSTIIGLRQEMVDVSKAITLKCPAQGQMSSIKRDVKKKVLPRPEGEKILSRDPAHFTVRVPLDLRERGCF
jgi:hypothetical protein